MDTGLTHDIVSVVDGCKKACKASSVQIGAKKEAKHPWSAVSQMQGSEMAGNLFPLIAFADNKSQASCMNCFVIRGGSKKSVPFSS